MNLSAIIGNSQRSELLKSFWDERGPENMELLYVTAALMAGKQNLSPVTALSISNSIFTAATAEFAALLELAKCMEALGAVGAAMNDDNLSRTFQGEIADAIISIGERISRFGTLFGRNK